MRQETGTRRAVADEQDAERRRGKRQASQEEIAAEQQSRGQRDAPEVTRGRNEECGVQVRAQRPDVLGVREKLASGNAARDGRGGWIPGGSVAAVEGVPSALPLGGHRQFLKRRGLRAELSLQ